MKGASIYEVTKDAVDVDTNCATGTINEITLYTHCSWKEDLDDL